MWFRTVHDLIPTNKKLYRISLPDTPTCQMCNQTNTTLHRMMSRLGGRDIWHWTHSRIALMLSIDPQHVTVTWLLFSALHIWTPPRQSAIIWLMSHVIYFSFREHPTLDLQDCTDFLRRSRWTTYRWNKRTEVYGNYLEVLDYTGSTTHEDVRSQGQMAMRWSTAKCGSKR
jgi:hypothetical protein